MNEPSDRNVIIVMMTLWIGTIAICVFIAAMASSWWTYRLMSGDIKTLQADVEVLFGNKK